MSTIATLAVVLKAKAVQFAKSMANSTKLLLGFGRVAASTGIATALLSSKFVKFGLVAAAAFIAVKVVIGVFNRAVSQLVDNLGRLAKKLEMTTGKLSGFQHAAAMSGDGADRMSQALSGLSMRLYQVGEGLEGSGHSLRKWGINAQALADLPLPEALKVIADRMSKLDSQAAKTAMSMEIFGTDLVDTLERGSRSLEAMEREARLLGLAFSKVDTGALRKLQESFTRLKAGMSAFASEVAIAFAPLMQVLMDVVGMLGAILRPILSIFLKVVKIVGKVIQLGTAVKILKPLIGLITIAFKLTEAVLEGIVELLDWITKGVEQIGAALAGVWKGIEGIFNWVASVPDVPDYKPPIGSEQIQAIRDYNEGLRQQIRLYGMSTREREIALMKQAQWVERIRAAEEDRAELLKIHNMELVRANALWDRLEKLDLARNAAIQSKEAFQASGIEDWIESMETALATAGMTGPEAELWEMRRRGAKLAKEELEKFNTLLAKAGVLTGKLTEAERMRGEAEKMRGLDEYASRVEGSLEAMTLAGEGYSNRMISFLARVEKFGSRFGDEFLEKNKGALDEMQGMIEEMDFMEKAAGLKRSAVALTEAMRTPLEKYNDEMTKLNKMLEDGMILQETYNRAAAEAKTGMLGGREEQGEFKTIRAAYVDVGGLAGRDPVIGAVDKVDQTIKNVTDQILQEMREGKIE